MEETNIKNSPEKSLPESIERKIKEINQKKEEAAEKYNSAKKKIKKVILEIKNTGGEFDAGPVEDTVTDIVNFLAQDNNAFSYLSQENSMDIDRRQPLKTPIEVWDSLPEYLRASVNTSE